MELKLVVDREQDVLAVVLIVPFMELKPKHLWEDVIVIVCLNRTFYGIETEYYSNHQRI